MLTAISAGVSAPMDRPIGECSLESSSFVKPSFCNRSRVSRTLFCCRCSRYNPPVSAKPAQNRMVGLMAARQHDDVVARRDVQLRLRPIERDQQNACRRRKQRGVGERRPILQNPDAVADERKQRRHLLRNVPAAEHDHARRGAQRLDQSPGYVLGQYGSVGQMRPERSAQPRFFTRENLGAADRAMVDRADQIRLLASFEQFQRAFDQPYACFPGKETKQHAHSSAADHAEAVRFFRIKQVFTDSVRTVFEKLRRIQARPVFHLSAADGAGLYAAVGNDHRRTDAARRGTFALRNGQQHRRPAGAENLQHRFEHCFISDQGFLSGDRSAMHLLCLPCTVQLLDASFFRQMRRMSSF